MLGQGISHITKFNENISQSIPFVPPGNTVTLFSFQVPSRASLRLTKFANYTDTPAGVGSIIWSLRRNGIPISKDNLGAVLDIIGQSYCPEEIEVDEFRGGDLFEVVVTNGHVAALIMGVRLVFELGDN